METKEVEEESIPLTIEPTKNEEPVEVETTATEENKVGGIVKDIKFTLNTAQSGKAIYITDVIKGELDGIIIKTSQPIELKISLDEYDIGVFYIRKLYGDVYVSIRKGCVDELGQDFKIPEKWLLNNKLKFEVSGTYNTIINFVIRYK